MTTDSTVSLIILIGLICFLAICWTKMAGGKPERVAAAEVTVGGYAYPVLLLHDKGSGKTLRCIQFDRSLIILPDAVVEKGAP